MAASSWSRREAFRLGGAAAAHTILGALLEHTGFENVVKAEASGESVDVSERGAKSAPEVISAPKPSCPKCGKIFNRFGGIFRKHLMHDHGLASTKAGELMYEIQKAFDADRLSK